MLSMIYRYFSIRFKRFTANTSIILCIIGYFFPFLIFASCSNIAISSSLSFNTAVLDGMVENLESYHMVLTTEISNHPSLIILTLAVTCGLVPIYFVMYWCRHQIHKTLKQTRSVHSPSTRDNARRLVRVSGKIVIRRNPRGFCHAKINKLLIFADKKICKRLAKIIRLSNSRELVFFLFVFISTFFANSLKRSSLKNSMVPESTKYIHYYCSGAIVMHQRAPNKPTNQIKLCTFK